MKLYQDNKPFFMFLLRFAVSYLVLAGLYWLYLAQFDAGKFEADGVTHVVARQASALIRFLGDESYITPHPSHPSYKLMVNEKYVSRIVEGCNAVSVMILFAAFVVAFYVGIKKTAIFIVAGVIVIHLLNVLRVALLCVSGYYYPEYWDVLHDIAFPVFIYGVVFILWIIWVLKFYGNAKKVTA